MGTPDNPHHHLNLIDLKSPSGEKPPRIDPQGLLEDLAYWQTVDPGANQKWMFTKQGIEPVICPSKIRQELLANGTIQAMYDHTPEGNPVITLPKKM